MKPRLQASKSCWTFNVGKKIRKSQDFFLLFGSENGKSVFPVSFVLCWTKTYFSKFGLETDLHQVWLFRLFCRRAIWRPLHSSCLSSLFLFEKEFSAKDFCSCVECAERQRRGARLPAGSNLISYCAINVFSSEWNK